MVSPAAQTVTLFDSKIPKNISIGLFMYETEPLYNDNTRRIVFDRLKENRNEIHVKKMRVGKEWLRERREKQFHLEDKS